MSLRTLTALLMTAVCTVAITSCSGGPGNEEDFHFTSLKTDEDAGASFDIDLSDSTCVYDISLIARFKKDAERGNVTFLVSLTSPSGQSGSERVTLPSDYRTVRDYIRTKSSDDRIKAASAPGYYDISWLYRSNVIPLEYGQWKMTVSAVPETDTYIIGLGISVGKTPLAGR